LLLINISSPVLSWFVSQLRCKGTAFF